MTHPPPEATPSEAVRDKRLPPEAELLASLSPQHRRLVLQRQDAMRSANEAARMRVGTPEPQTDEEWARRAEWARRTRTALHARYRRERVQQRASVSMSGRTVERPRERRPGATRRTSSSSTTASADPGDSGDSDGPGEPAAATLRVRRPSGLLDVFVADEITVDGASITATGRFRRRVGLNYAEFRWSPPGTYRWPTSAVREVAS